jgi:hypothetical protein
MFVTTYFVIIHILWNILFLWLKKIQIQRYHNESFIFLISVNTIRQQATYLLRQFWVKNIFGKTHNLPFIYFLHSLQTTPKTFHQKCLCAWPQWDIKAEGLFLLFLHILFIIQDGTTYFTPVVFISSKQWISFQTLQIRLPYFFAPALRDCI